MNPPPVNFFRLSTDQFPERDRIEAAREIIGRSLMKLQFELRPDVPFSVDMLFRALPDFVLASGICSAMDCVRTPELIRAVARDAGSALPETVLSMVQVRLEAFDAEARLVLRAASIFGETFWAGGVSASGAAGAGAPTAPVAGTSRFESPCAGAFCSTAGGTTAGSGFNLRRS